MLKVVRFPNSHPIAIKVQGTWLCQRRCLFGRDSDGEAQRSLGAPVAGLLVLRDVSGRSGVYRQEICPDEASSTTSSTILPSYLCPPAHHVIFPQQDACFAPMIVHDIPSSLFLSFSFIDCFYLEILLTIFQRFLAIDFGFMDHIDFIGFFCFTDLAALEI